MKGAPVKFAFVVHPLGAVTQQLNAIQPSLEMRQYWGRDLPAFCRQLQDEIESARERLLSPRGCQVRVVDDLPLVTSITGATASGRFYEIPQTPAQLLADPSSACEAVVEAVRMAAKWGAEIVGLGALTGTLGAGGSLIAEQAPVSVTTGNSLTAYAAVQNVQAVCHELEIALHEETLTIIGAPGSIATAAARLLAPLCGRLLLVGRSESPRFQRLGSELSAEVSTSIADAIRESRLIVTATSSGLCLDPQRLLPGSVVWDVAVPADVLPTSPTRSDVLLLTSGLTALPAGCSHSGGYLWLHRGVIPSCLGETLLLAFDERRESYSLGRQLDIDRIREIGHCAEQHHFGFSQMFVDGLPLSTSELVQFRQQRLRIASGRRPIAKQATDLSPSDHERASTRFGRHINPALATVLEHSDLQRTFVRGSGCCLWDAAGCEFLDFVAGFGSVNLGHNHPAVIAAITAAMHSSAAGFTPGSVNPHAAKLAERLVLIAPPGMEIVTFVNSGAEAVEAALKLARAATGRTTLLACDRGYHGKTLGALSVTGHRDYRRPFEPLLPDSHSVAFGDIESLSRALRTHRAAAFIVEPVAAEGGMYPLPPGFLRQASELCRQAGTLLIVDEVQTGLGRTGRMFAVDHDGVTPDILCLAKSLGGGHVPIGAILSRPDPWQRAYGTLDTCLLHTSTFAGGSLASAAALASLDVLEQEELASNAAARGAELLAGLQQLAERFAVIREVRGLGLLLGVEFTPLPEVIATHWSQQAGLLSVLLPKLRERVDELPAFYVLQTLLRKHGIFAQLCRSKPNVLRVEPPLTVSAAEVRKFLAAMEASVAEIELTNLMFATCLSKTVRGELDWLSTPPNSNTDVPEHKPE